MTSKLEFVARKVEIHVFLYGIGDTRMHAHALIVCIIYKMDLTKDFTFEYNY